MTPVSRDLNLALAWRGNIVIPRVVSNPGPFCDVSRNIPRHGSVFSMDPAPASDLNRKDDHHVILDRGNNPVLPYPMRVNQDALVLLQLVDM